MKQREVILRTQHLGHHIELVRLTEVLDIPGRQMRVERWLQAFINGAPLKELEHDRSGLQQELLELAQAVAEQLPRKEH